MLALTVLILTFVGAVIIINTSVSYTRAFERNAKRVLEADTVNTVSSSLDSLCNYLDSSLASFNDCCDYYVFEGGNIIASSREGGVVTLTPRLASALGIKAESEKQGLDLANVTNTGYVVYLVDSKDELHKDIFKTTLLFLQALAFAVVVAAIISFFISKRLTHSIKELEEGAKRMSDGRYQKIQVTGQDEIARLCDVFNEMGEQIQSDYDQFEKVEKSRREFVANVSHELKTPLTVIKSYSETLQNMELDRDTKNQFLSVINSEVDRMADIVGQLLQLSKLESPVLAPSVQIDIYALCQDIADSFKIEAAKKDCEIIVSGNLSVFSEKEKVKTILTNLISNAVKYSDKNQNVYIDITDNKVKVANTGIGIEKEDIPHIFERFYRSDPARNRKTGGTGLGLAIAKESADSIGARLYVSSTPSKNTDFILEF